MPADAGSNDNSIVGGSGNDTIDCDTGGLELVLQPQVDECSPLLAPHLK